MVLLGLVIDQFLLFCVRCLFFAANFLRNGKSALAPRPGEISQQKQEILVIKRALLEGERAPRASEQDERGD